MTIAEHAVTPEELMAWLDGEATADRGAQIEGHVLQCAECQRIAAGFRQLSRDVTSWQVEDAPSTLEAPAIERPAAPEPRKAWWAWLHPPLHGRFALIGSLAGIAAVVLIAAQVRGRMSMSYADPGPPTAEMRTRFGGSPGRETPGNAGARANAPRVMAAERVPAPAQQAAVRQDPMIVRTASLSIVAANFDAARAEVDRILREVGGFVGQIQVSEARGSARALHGTLRVPAARLDEALAALKRLGHVAHESQGGDDVTEQVVDMGTRLANARVTEKRLADLLRERTGSVEDVLRVEQEIARVRGEIERLEGERTTLTRRVTYATITLDVAEERKSSLDLGPTTLSGRFRNALIEGFQSALEGAVGMTLVALRAGPSLLLLAAVLFWPARLLMRASRRVS
jgi:uncharacterized protein DUF4349/putative zinc finger protein